MLVCFADNVGHGDQPEDQGHVPCRQPAAGPGDAERGSGAVPEESERLPGQQEERLPQILLHLRRRTALHPRQLRPLLCAGTHDQGVNTKFEQL